MFLVNSLHHRISISARHWTAISSHSNLLCGNRFISEMALPRVASRRNSSRLWALRGCLGTLDGNSWSDNSGSFSVTVTAIPPTPHIRVQPHNQVGYWGKSATFSVAASGWSPLNYQWQKDNVSIAGATAASLILTNLEMNAAGNYSVVITNVYGSVTSSNAYLEMNPAGVSLALYSGITIDGVVGLTYGIQYSTDLSNPNGWLGLANVTLSVPTMLWFDMQPASQPQRYYRVVPGPISIP